MQRSLATLILTALLCLGAATSARADSAADGRRTVPAPAKCLHSHDYGAFPHEKRDLPGILEDRADTPAPPAGDRGYDVQSYDLDVRLHPDIKTIDGSVIIGLRALDQPLDRIRLDLVDELTVTAVTSGAADLMYTHGGDSLIVHPAAPVTPGADFTLTVAWNGRPPRHGNYSAGLLFRSHDAGTPYDPSDDRPAICSVSEPWSAHAWWPCKDHPADKAQVSVAVTVPDDLIAVANGEFLSQSASQPGWLRFAYRETYPLATYLVAIYASDYVSWHEDCWVTVADPPGQPVPLEFYAFPFNEQNVRADLAVTCDMLEFWSDLVGAYPFAGEKYAQLEVDWGGAMENQTVTALGSFLLQGTGRFEPIVIHELAHHWFGNSLTPAVWNDIWLNEGFARYSEALWIEYSQGRTAYIDFMHDIGHNAHADLFQDREPLLEPSPVLPNILVYDKGAWVLHMLRLLVGDEAFFAFLADYATDPSLVMGSVTTDEMIAVAEASTGRSLQGFFAPWLTTSDIPVLRYSVQKNAGGGADLVVRQVKEPYFEVAVPVRIEHSEGTTDHLIHVASGYNYFSLPVSSTVETVTMDPDTLVLMESREEPLYSLDIRGPYPNPVAGESASFELFVTSDAKTTVRVVDISGKVSEKWDLGVIPATGESGDPVASPYIWQWRPGGDGRQRPAAGVYNLVFTANGVSQSRKVTLLH